MRGLKLRSASNSLDSWSLSSLRCSLRFGQFRESPWQNAYVERLIGSIRRECLDHVIVLSLAGLQRVLADYVEYDILRGGSTLRRPRNAKGRRSSSSA